MREDWDAWEYDDSRYGSFEVHFFRTAELMRDAILKVEPTPDKMPHDAAGYCNLNGDDGAPMIFLAWDILTGDEFDGDTVVTHECAHLALLLMRKRYGKAEDESILLTGDREEEFCELQGRLIKSAWEAFGQIAIDSVEASA